MTGWWKIGMADTCGASRLRPLISGYRNSIRQFVIITPGIIRQLAQAQDSPVGFSRRVMKLDLHTNLKHLETPSRIEQQLDLRRLVSERRAEIVTESTDDGGAISDINLAHNTFFLSPFFRCTGRGSLRPAKTQATPTVPISSALLLRS